LVPLPEWEVPMIEMDEGALDALLAEDPGA
jgi:hypothetical protein